MRLSTFTLALLAAASIAVAQTEKPQGDKPASRPTDTRQETPVPDVRVPGKETPFACKASDVIGAKVKNMQGDDLAKIDDLVVDPATGSIEYAVLSFGGVIGMGDKLVAVPFEKFPVASSRAEDKDAGKKEIALDLDKAKLEKAPSFTKSTWPDVAHSQWTSDIDKYYGVSRAPNGTSPGGASPSGSTIGAKRDASSLHGMRATELLGQKIESTGSEDLGKVKEIVLDRPRGRITYFVMSSGGVLGMGDKLYAIPWEALKCEKQGNMEKCSLAVSKDRLERAPEYKDNDWKTMSDPTWIGEMYVFYGYEPYWRPGAVDAAYRSGTERP